VGERLSPSSESEPSFFSAGFCGCFGAPRSSRSAANGGNNFRPIADGTRMRSPVAFLANANNSASCALARLFQEELALNKTAPLPIRLTGTCELPTRLDTDALWQAQGYVWAMGMPVEVMNTGIVWEKDFRVDRRVMYPEQCTVGYQSDIAMAFCEENPYFSSYRLVVISLGNHTSVYLTTGKVGRPFTIVQEDLVPPSLADSKNGVLALFSGLSGRLIVFIAPKLNPPTAQSSSAKEKPGVSRFSLSRRVHTIVEMKKK